MTDQGETQSIVSHKWARIEDLPPDWRSMCREDLHDVYEQWMDERDRIEDEAEVQAFAERLQNLWAIETGVIERLYTVEKGVTREIVDAGMSSLRDFHDRGKISRSARDMIRDQRKALGLVMDFVGGSRDLNVWYLKELHQQLTLSQMTREVEDQFGRTLEVELVKGDWKKSANNPKQPDDFVHEYCPPEHVQSEMEQLLSWFSEHETLGVCPEVEAAWLHHRFTQIHPFEDGNGRMARSITGAVFLKADYLMLVVRDEEHRERYIDALQCADRKDLKPLVDLFADIQIHDLREAISSLRKLRDKPMATAIGRVAELVKQRSEDSKSQAADVLEVLLGVANGRLEEASGQVSHLFTEAGVAVETKVIPGEPDHENPERPEWWSWQIIEAAKHYGYFADLNRYRRWVSLRLNLPEMGTPNTHLVLSFHAMGRSRDVYVATAFLTHRLPGSGNGDERELREWANEVVADRPLEFGTESERIERIRSKFEAWLDTVVERGLNMWLEQV